MKEYTEKVALGGSTIAQFQSRAAKTFAAIGWKLENFTKISISATKAPKDNDDRTHGKVELSFIGDECEISFSLANPPMLMAGNTAKLSIKPFVEQFAKETPDASADNADEHEKAMMEALMAANKREEERLAAIAAREAKIKKIQLIFRSVVPLICGIIGANAGGGQGFLVGLFVGLVLNEILICLWKILLV